MGFDEADKLEKFFGLIQSEYFNDKKPINHEYRHSIETHFDYYWNNNLNAAIDDPDEKYYLDQLDSNTVNKLYRDYLFTDFLTTFKDYFLVPHKLETHKLEV